MALKGLHKFFGNGMILFGFIAVFVILVSGNCFSLTRDEAWDKLKKTTLEIKKKKLSELSDFEAAVAVYGYQILNQVGPKKDYSEYFIKTTGPEIKLPPQTLPNKGQTAKSDTAKNSLEEKVFEKIIKKIINDVIDLSKGSGPFQPFKIRPIPIWVDALKPTELGSDDDDEKKLEILALEERGKRGFDELAKLLMALEPQNMPSQSSSMIPRTELSSNEVKETTNGGSMVVRWWDKEKKLKELEYAVKDGKKVGPFRRWYRNGNKETEGEYIEDGLKTGRWQAWYENGSLRWVADFKNGENDGVAVEYDQSGNKRSEKNYKSGKIESTIDVSGRQTVYSPGGEKIAEGGLKDGKRDGEWVLWDEEGRPNKRNYVNGMPIGN